MAQCAPETTALFAPAPTSSQIRPLHLTDKLAEGRFPTIAPKNVLDAAGAANHLIDGFQILFFGRIITPRPQSRE